MNKQEIFTEITAVNCHTNLISGVLFLPDNRTIISGSYDGTVVIFNYNNKKITKRFQLSAPVKAISFSEKTNQILAFSDDKIIHIWDRDSYKKINEFPVLGPKTEYRQGGLGRKYVINAKFTMDGEFIVLGCQDKNVYVLPVREGEKSSHLKGHSMPVLSVGWSPTKEWIYSAAQFPDSVLRIWKWPENQIIKEIDLKGQLLNAVFSSDGSKLAATGFLSRKVKIIDVLSGEMNTTLTLSFIELDEVESLCFYPDSCQTIIAGSFKGSIVVWNIKTRRYQLFKRAHQGNINTIAFSKDGSYLGTTDGKNYIIKIWKINIGLMK
jgi:WD40 repeat protein